MAYPSPETRTADSKRHNTSLQPPTDLQSKDFHALSTPELDGVVTWILALRDR
jgi:hypothetical protein